MSESQDARMREILFRLSLLQHGGTQAWNPSGGQSGEPDDKFVAMVDRADSTTHAAFQRSYANAETHEGREIVIKHAQEILDLLSKPRDWQKIAAQDAEPLKTTDELVVEDGVGYEPDVVGRRYGLNGNHVRRIRQRAGRDSETGEKLTDVTLEAVDKVTKARELRGRGMSNRQIALIVDVSPQTIGRWFQSPSVGVVE